MNLTELTEKIKSHLVAGYPGLYIHSSEEARVDTMLRDVATQLQLSPKEWNLGYGWVDFFNKQPRGNQGPDTELANSLPALLDDDLTGKLLIIKDAKSALENQPLAVARLKQLLNRIQRHHRANAAVILVSETLFIPPQIESQITLLPLPLPRGEEISAQIDSVCQHIDLVVPEPLRPRLNATCSGLSQEEIRLALAMVRLQYEQVNESALALIQHEKEQIIAKSGVLEMIKVSENAADVGGLENLKLWLGRRAQIFRRLGEAEQSGVQAPKGVLIAGMPGCGKSLTAKAAAGLFQLPLLRLDIGSLLGKYVGESEHNMRRALTMAESVSPCILWIDELEKSFVGMNSGSGSEVSSRLFGYFLTWMQEKTGSVFVIATANNITALPPELLRKGRFDEVFYVGFPNALERGAILDIHLRGDGLAFSPEERKALIAQCRDYAGADIQNAINEARESAFLDNRTLSFEDIETAIKLTVPLRETLRDQVGKYEELFEKLKLKPASTFEGLSVAQMIKLSDDPNRNRRKTVACDPDCPDDLLEKLAGDPVQEIRTAVYQNPNCPERLLTVRINIEEGQPDFDLDLLHLACTHAHAPHDLLTTQFARLKLSTEHKRQLARKSHYEPLHRLLFSDDNLAVRRALVHNKTLGSDTHRLLAKDPKVAIRKALAGIIGLSSDVQALLANDDSFEVREALAELDNLDEAVQLNLARDGDMDVRLALAGRSGEARLSDEVQLTLIKDCLEVRQQLAANERLCAAAQLLLANDASVKVRETLAEHPALATATWQYLVEDTESVQVKLAGNSHLNSATLLMNLGQSDSEDVRNALASNPHLDDSVQALLAKDASETVRAALAGNDHTSSEILKILMLDKAAKVRQRLTRWRQTVLPDVQRHLVHDAEQDVRTELAYARDLLEDVQQQLAQDTAEVQAALATNACINTSAQQLLLNKGDLETRRNLARNGASTGPVQAILADDGSVEVRGDLARNSELASPVADKLLNDVEEVQAHLARNTRLSEAHYWQLFKNGSDEVRVALAGNSSIGPALMTHIIETKLTRSISQQKTSEGLGADNQPNSFFAAFAEISARAANPKTTTAKPASTSERVSELHLALARNCTLPADMQSAYTARAFSSWELMDALASQSSLSPSVQSLLATHGDARVRERLANNLNVAREVKVTLLNDPEPAVRMALIQDGWMDEEIETQLAEDTVVDVRLALAATSRLRKRTQLTLARDPKKEVRTQLLTPEGGVFFGALKSEVQATLAHDTDLRIRQQLAQYPQLGPSVQVKLATDDSVNVRKTLASQSEHLFSAALVDEAQYILQKDLDVSVRLALTENRKLLPEVQALLASDHDTKVKLSLIENNSSWRHNLSIAAQQVLATDANPEVRTRLASTLFGIFSPASTEHIRLLLAGDTDEGVRRSILACIASARGGTKCSEAVMARLREGASELELSLLDKK